MTGRRVGRLTLLLELAMLAASLGGAGPVADGVRVIGLIVVGVLGGLAVSRAVPSDRATDLRSGQRLGRAVAGRQPPSPCEPGQGVGAQEQHDHPQRRPARQG